ncbi:MAG: hypothetical protein QOC94_1775 [Actinoplanes sp.]|jgi:hypothetical protein|nr:hypothetical protein [Actinoplanes sp.]
MVERVLPRFLAAAGALVAALAVTLGAGAAAAQAAPKVTTPTSLTITGTGIAGPVVVQAAGQPGVFRQLLSEVSWLATAKPQISAPKADRLGPKYALTVLVKDRPIYAYDLYPEATGGPRAHRPAKQPNGKKVADGWFYGRLTMSESLRVSGVPLIAKPDVVSGGIGGGLGAGVVQDKLDPVPGVNQFLAQMRELLLLNGAVLVVILFGLAGISYLIRGRV